MYVDGVSSGLRAHRLLFAALLLVAVLGLAVSTAAATQLGGALVYGSGAVGSVSVEAPLAIYTFGGSAGDLVTARATALTAGLELNISLLAPSQQVLASSAADAFRRGGEAEVSVRLAESGTYLLMVSSANGVGGEFAVRLDGRLSTVDALLEYGVAATVGFSPDALLQVLSFSGRPDGLIALTASAITPDFGFIAQVRDSAGHVVGVLGGAMAQTACLTLPPGEEVYEVAVAALSPDSEGEVALVLGDTCGVMLPAALPGPSVQQPTSTPIYGGQPVTTPLPDVCSVGPTGINAVNIRSGPGTASSVIGQLLPGNYLGVVGYYPATDGFWYAVEYGVLQGWVAGGVVQVTGPCTGLQIIDPLAATSTTTVTPTGTLTTTVTYTPTITYTPSLTYTPGGPTVTPTATYTSTATYTATYTPTFTRTPTLTHTPIPGAPTATNTYTPTATSTYTPSFTPSPPGPTYTPSFTPTATYTPTPPFPSAPPDANFNSPLNIPLDSTASTTDFVSYPDGDVEDRVRYDVTGMNPNASLSGGRARLIITASCFGTGTAFIQFFTGGQTFSCGQTIVDREITADSRTGQVTITAVGAPANGATYVQWVLTGSATRIN